MFVIYNYVLNKYLDEILLYLSKSNNFTKSNNIYEHKFLTFYKTQKQKKTNYNYNNLLLNSYRP